LIKETVKALPAKKRGRDRERERERKQVSGRVG
jgi:hypothetical protein